MNFKKVSIISLLISANIITAIFTIVLYFAMKNNLADLYKEQIQFMHTLEVKKKKYKNHILLINKDLNIEQFKNKHGISKRIHSTNEDSIGIEYKDIFFSFSHGVLSDIQ